MSLPHPPTSRNDVDEYLKHVDDIYLIDAYHPYIDGNGRTGRFLMNVMLASGRYPWTVIPLDTRAEYMAALEEASVQINIEPFIRFLASLVQKGMASL